MKTFFALMFFSISFNSFSQEEIIGGKFALTIRQQILKEKEEINAVREMVASMHEPMQTAFDYTIRSEKPKSLDSESEDWGIPIVVDAIANKNMEFCYNNFIKTLSSLSLTPEEVTTYQSLNKKIFPVEVQFGLNQKKFYLRKIQSIYAISAILNQWEWYISLFKIKDIDWKEYSYKGEFNDLSGNGDWFNKSFFGRPNGNWNDTFNDNNFIKLHISFMMPGSKAGTFSWIQNFTLSEIENFEKLVVAPLGIISKFKFGGFVVSEEGGHGLIASIFDIGVFNWEDANNFCQNLEFNGFVDWRLPSWEELKTIRENLGQFKNGAFTENWHYWSSNQSHNGRLAVILSGRHRTDKYFLTSFNFVRAVRSY